MGGQTWADFHSQLRTLATVPLTDHMTKLAGKTFSGLLGSYQIKRIGEPRVEFQDWKLGSTPLCC